MLLLEWEVLPRELSVREQSAAAHALLCRMLEARGIPCGALSRDTNGRPFLPHAPHLDFNISHTAGLAACAVECLDAPRARGKEAASVGEGAAPLLSARPRVGVDVEELPRELARAERLAARFFAPAEKACFAAASNKPLAFAEIFTAKEAYAKFVGDGFSHHTEGTDTKAPLFCETHGILFETRHFPESGHFLTLCRRAETTYSLDFSL